MAKEIGGTRQPGDEGTKVGDIQTPMCPENVDRQNTPKILTYDSVTRASTSGGAGVMGPGMKNKY